MIISIRYFSPLRAYRILAAAKPRPPRAMAYLGEKIDHIESYDPCGFFLIMFWICLLSALLIACLFYVIAFPWMRLARLRSRIAFWQTLKLHHGMYFQCVAPEYDEAMRAHEIMDNLS